MFSCLPYIGVVHIGDLRRISLEILRPANPEFHWKSCSELDLVIKKIFFLVFYSRRLFKELIFGQKFWSNEGLHDVQKYTLTPETLCTYVYVLLSTSRARSQKVMILGDFRRFLLKIPIFWDRLPEIDKSTYTFTETPELGCISAHHGDLHFIKTFDQKLIP